MKRFRLWLASLTIAATATLGACGGSSGETCNAFGGACPMRGTLEQCCTSTTCHYKASDGTDFPCNGTDCSAATMMATNWCAAH